MIEVLYILSGPAPLHCIVRDALRNMPNCRVRLSVVGDLRQLWFAPCGDIVEIAILDSTLSLLDLKYAASLIRRQWPAARIVLLRSDGESLDDELYDERMPPTATPADLLAVIRQLPYESRKGNFA